MSKYLRILANSQTFTRFKITAFLNCKKKKKRTFNQDINLTICFRSQLYHRICDFVLVLNDNFN